MSVFVFLLFVSSGSVSFSLLVSVFELNVISGIFYFIVFIYVITCSIVPIIPLISGPLNIVQL